MSREQTAEAPHVRKAANKFIGAVDRALDAFEELKAARAALSQEVSRPPLKVAEEGAEGGR